MKPLRYTLAGISAVIVLGPPVAAFAQKGVEEIVVTAQRRAERIEDVPMSITAVDPATLDRHNVVGMDQLGQIATGVQMNYAGGFFQPAIRGVTTLTNGNNVETNIAVYTDGFYDSSTISINTDMANLQDIQVLKGPQGTLYGRNATGGAILINTLGPTKEFTGKLEASWGRFDDKTLTGYIAGPITDNVRFSIAGHHRDTPGYLKLIDPTTIGKYLGNTGKIKRDGLRAKLEVDLSDNLTATLGYSYAYNQDNRTAYYSVYDHVNPAIEPAPPLRPTIYGTVATNDVAKEYAFRSQGTLKLAYNTPIGMLTSYTGYSAGIDHNQFDFDGSYADLSYFYSKFRSKTFQQSADWAINAIKNLDLIVGGLYFHDQLETPANGTGNLSYTANHVLVQRTRDKTPTSAWAAYVDGTYHLSDRLTLTAGGRFSHEHKEMHFQQQNGAGAFIVAPFVATKTWTKFTPRASVRYELAPQTNIYASFSRGFRSGNYNGGGPTPGVPYLPTEPETVSAYEIGFKTAQSIYRFNLAGFYYDYKKINVSVLVPNPTCPPGATCTIVTLFGNAPGAKIYGIDAEATVTPVENLDIRAGGEWLHARYITFPNATGTGVNATNTVNVTNQIQDWTGIQLARAPNFTFNIGIDYRIPLSYGSLALGTNVNYTSQFAMYNPTLFGPLAPADLQRKERYIQTAYALLSAQVTFYGPDEKYYVRIYGNNLTDHQYFISRNGSAFGDTRMMAEPITYGVKVGVKLW